MSEKVNDRRVSSEYLRRDKIDVVCEGRRKRREVFGFIARSAVSISTEQGKTTSVAQLMQARHILSVSGRISFEQGYCLCFEVQQLAVNEAQVAV